jgi:hypothetical protein
VPDPVTLSDIVSRGFSKPLVALLDESKILSIRAGMEEHRFLGVWVVVTGGRVFVRPFNDKATGWYRRFLEEPRGLIQVGDREVRVRAVRRTAERLLDLVDAAYAAKYHTPASRKWVRGFHQPRRRATTLELLPR